MRENMKNNSPCSAPVRISLWKRIVTHIVLFTFFFQTTGYALAAGLTGAIVKTDLSSDTNFQYVPSSIYQYEEAYRDDIPQSYGNYQIEDFYSRLLKEAPSRLGASVIVPVSIGGVFKPIKKYNNLPAVGSAFVQNRYVRNQIHELLGRHLIDSDNNKYRSEFAQLKTLYSNAMTFAVDQQKTYSTMPGFSRTDAPYDMIWPEKKLVNGKWVMVPVVYLTKDTVEARKVDGHTVVFNGKATFEKISIDGVDVHTGREGFLSAAENFSVENGAILSDGDLELYAGGTLSLLSSQIKAQGDISLFANNIHAETLVHRFDLGNEVGTYFGEVTSIDSETGDVTLRSATDIVLQGVAIYAGENITFGADGNIYIGSQLISSNYNNKDSGWKEERSETEYLVSSLGAGGSIELIASGHIKIDAAELVADRGHIEILAGMGITIEDDLASSQSYLKGKFGKTTIEESAYRTVAMRALLDAGKDIRIHSDFGDITLKAADITSTEGTSVTASGGGVNLLMTTETDHYSYSSVSKSLFTVETIQQGHYIETGVPNTIVGGFAVEALKGLTVQYEGDPDLTLDEQINELSQFEGLEWLSDIRSATEHEVDWDEMSYRYEEWKVDNTSMTPAFAAVVAIAVSCVMGPGGFAVANTVSGTAVVASTGSTMAAAVGAGAAAMATQFSMAAINGAINGDIGQAMEEFASNDTLKSLAVSMVTAGALEKLSSVGGDFFSGVAQDSAWVAENPEMFSLMAQAGQAVVDATVRAGVSVAIQGGDFSDQFVQSLAQSAINRLGKELAQKIGAFHKENNEIGRWDISDSLRYISHAATGCLTGALIAGMNDGDAESSCVYGAGGAVVGEATADIYKEINSYDDLSAEGKAVNDLLKAKLGDNFQNMSAEQIAALTDGNYELRVSLADIEWELEKLKQSGVDLARFSAAMGAFVSGAEAEYVNLAADTGENAAENNALFLIPLIKGGMLIWTAVEIYQAGERVLKLAKDLENAETEEERQKILLELLELAGTELFMSVAGRKLEAVADILRKTEVGSALESKADDLIAKLNDKRREKFIEGLDVEPPKVMLDRVDFNFDDPSQVSYNDFFNSVTDFQVNPDLKGVSEEAYSLFVHKKWNELEDLVNRYDINGGWPPFNGAIAEVKGALQPGSRLDRIGGYYQDGNFIDQGNYFAGLGEPFTNRALKDVELDKVLKGEKGYKAYEVLIEIPDVSVAKAIPWFGQSGEGLQYRIDIDVDELAGRTPIQYLVDEGYIREIVNQ